MIRAALRYLRCPHCGESLLRVGSALRCANGHSFDVARHGYVALLGPRAPAGGDDAAMVAAREAFLHAGHFAPLTEALGEELARAADPDGCVVDLGAGTGHHLAAVLDRLPARVGVALDASSHALRRAGRAHPRVGAVRCDVREPLPVRDEVAAVAMSVFAPRNGAETRRILVPNGTLVVAAPTPAHLAEIVEPLGLLSVDERKGERLDRTLGAYLTPAGDRRLEWSMRLSREEVRALAGMGPSARHTGSNELEDRITTLSEPVLVTGSVSLSRHVRRGSPRTAV